MNQIKLNLIGAGRVGQTLLTLFNELSNCQIQDVLSASLISAQKAVRRTGAGRAVDNISDLRPADLWIIAVPDTQISAVAADLASALPRTDTTAQPPIAFHCSGFFPADEMAPLRDLNWRLASVHPVLSFADPEKAKDQFRGALCGLEGDPEALEFLQPLMVNLGAECFSIRSEGKSLYHAAAVISNNFAVVLQAIACEAWADAGVADDVIPQLNAKLLESTVENITSLGPQDALTGPAARGDEEVVASQGRDVARWHPQAGNVYRALSDMARSLKKDGSTK
ncbi:Rossmann-like and DUF2520 domain-containing protein [Ruegeria sp. Ofav3-42]|uniref:Rossmann-like and DUF2520 domain-containing protein n=1 Tax=Ruegeria sp. Ofav3-42 TaxID=2917759 RepID=UPI0021029A29|nr:Rossmann-like and DUF2520 domain-containing protein [Ruegeria sp. Ofav3-42]MCG7521412.1 DUF2520 domain-containing protein [Ruegeria sp. Ofav3-42]